jgi:protoheme IX farnesyltransferase
MPRTADRPLASGRLTPAEALAFSAMTGIGGVAYLLAAVGWVTALLGLITWLMYVAIYTPMKVRSVHNTAIGAVAGAMPILMGWGAVGGHFDLGAAGLFGILFLWQFPHFMAIAWLYRRDYAAAGMKMLPVVDRTGRAAGLQAVCGALLLIPVSLLPAVAHVAGLHYVLWALLLGMAQLACAAAFLVRPNESSARWLLRASLIYLPSLLLMLLLGPFGTT